MNQSNLLQKLAPVGVAAFGAISFTGIATAPAQAGSLSWTNSTSSFIQDFLDESNNGILPTTFDVTFTPGEISSVFLATGEFVPPFPPGINPGSPQFFDVSSDIVSLNLESGTPDTTFIYELQDDLNFNFDITGNGFNPTEDVSVTIGAGSTFLGDFDTDNGNVDGLGFEEDELSEVVVNIAGVEYTLDDPLLEVTGESFSFDQAVGEEFGQYSGGTTVAGETVPEPATILGLLTVGGLGLGLKRKKQS